MHVIGPQPAARLFCRRREDGFTPKLRSAGEEMRFEMK
jgi:hypothetical protein